MNSIAYAAKNIDIQHNVSIRVIDELSGKVMCTHTGHNAATNSLLTGIAHYLTGDGVLNQGSYMLSNYIPKYISLGTMGLLSQDEDEVTHLPLGIDFNSYIDSVPGYGADGYDLNANNNRKYAGLGPMYTKGSYAVDCELISPSFPRAEISYRDIVQESRAEFPETLDVIFSAYISTGALKQFRNGADHIFITEAGLWSNREWTDSGDNGLLAGYRILPSNADNLDMSDKQNQDILRSSIIRVGINQVVQVIWKIQLGSISQLSPLNGSKIKWKPF